MTFISFGFFLLLFIAIGVLSTLKNKRTISDYLIASHSEKPWLIALSTVATNNSGYMFIGMIGYAYINGLSAMWIMICAIFGDFCASLFVYKNLRITSGKIEALSFPELISKWHGTNHKIIRILSAIIIVIFLSVYAAAQLSAGGKAMHSLFNLDYAIGAIVGAVIVLCYCLAGGIRASIWTNTAQSFVMISAMALLFFMSLKEIGGFSEYINQLKNVSPQYLSIFPSDLFFGQNMLGLSFFIFGWFFGGFGIIGQPHIMSSFMAMDNPKNINRVRIYYYSWYSGFYILTILTGLAARLIIPYSTGFDAELALPILSQRILPEILIGLILAGLFSSTMSAADSQILSCSAAIVNDLIPSKKNNYFTVKLATLLVTIFATLISITENKSVFTLANIGWLALACSFAPLVMIYALGGKMSQKLALTCMLTGFISMILWRYFGFGEAVYEAGPGIILGTLPYLIHKFFWLKSRNK